MRETLAMWECRFEPADTFGALFDQIERWVEAKGATSQVTNLTIICDYKDGKYTGYARYYASLESA